ncbi:FAD-dependent monooxygenase [Accumulibacter sp.]|uniref:FAD-dependent monooxygenase n=1 Tax=Accumulibacter sp. TaxID=2053492 RepID=UPI00260BFBDE|nr:FAD-dependent monooxygenase [Accumulibacter sp.]
MKTDNSEQADVAIIGAGPVGMALAKALAEGPFRVLLVDSRRRRAWESDPRALALSHGSRQILEQVGVWNSDAGTAIHSIHVSQRGGFGRTVIEASDYDLPALGYVMRYRDLAAGLYAGVESIDLIDDCRRIELTIGSRAVEIRLSRGEETRLVAARLVVHAEGSPASEAGVRVFDYRQHAVVAEVRPVPGHANRAWERFTPDGPLALLPLGDDYSVVFSLPPDQAKRLQDLAEDGFLAALRAQFGGRLDFVTSSARASFPLALRIRRQLTAPRQVWVGNAAQSLHPVSGQGFNLGLRDAWELAEALCRGAGDDAGAAPTLAAYARRRDLDRRGGMAFTDGIVRLFSNDLAALRLARGFGLQALDIFPPLRHFIARRMIWGARAWL